MHVMENKYMGNNIFYVETARENHRFFGWCHIELHYVVNVNNLK